jgi:molecular chaperone DnaJ
MAVFQDYLETCRQNLDSAKTLFCQRPNPAKMAKVAASLYYCLNHLTDGLEELETFTLNYDDSLSPYWPRTFRTGPAFTGGS